LRPDKTVQWNVFTERIGGIPAQTAWPITRPVVAMRRARHVGDGTPVADNSPGTQGFPNRSPDISRRDEKLRKSLESAIAVW
jgi:hypothetical protein